jgi:hypothetical protein
VADGRVDGGRRVAVHPQLVMRPRCRTARPRSLSRVDRTPNPCTDAPESAQTSVTPIDVGEIMGNAKPKSFCPWQPEQTTLLPPSSSVWLSDDHQVYFLLDLVDELDLSEILIPAQAKDPRREKGFAPRM